MIENYSYLIIFLGSGIIFLVAIFFLAKILRPNKPNDEKLSTYESGEQPQGNANPRFNPRFYILALAFVLFEAEMVVLFPWSVAFKSSEFQNLEKNTIVFGLVELLFFLLILGLGLGILYSKGYLNWERKEQKSTEFKSPIPKEAYKKYQ